MLFYSAFIMSMNHGVNKKTLASPFQVFIWFVYYFTINTSSFFCSDQIVAEDYEFPKVKQTFSFNSWLVEFDFAVYFCLYVVLRRF